MLSVYVDRNAVVLALERGKNGPTAARYRPSELAWKLKKFSSGLKHTNN
jgi:hypothetical protein